MASMTHWKETATIDREMEIALQLGKLTTKHSKFDLTGARYNHVREVPRSFDFFGESHSV